MSAALDFASAVQAVSEWLEGLPGSVRRLSARELSAYDHHRGFNTGWRLQVSFDDGARHIDILIDDWFPHSAPRIALVDRPEFLTWPHIERDGVLCLLPSTASCDPTAPVGVVQHVLDSACQLVQESIAGSNADDFRQEFLSYWGWAVPDKSPRLYSLLNPAPPTRQVRLWRGTSYFLLGDTDADVTNWISHRRGERIEATDNTETALLLWLDAPLVPAEYPRSGADLLALARRAGGYDLITRAAVEEPNRIVVAIGSTTANGPCFGAVTLPTPQTVLKGSNRRNLTLTAGFRKGKLPAGVLVSRYFSGTPVVKAVVDRIDARWVHGRDRSPHAEQLRAANVVLLGCGSVGAPVAMALTQAGVGRLSLVDPETLTWSNISRHPLGASAVGKNKAEALADRIRRDCPQIVEITGYPRRWQDLARTSPQLVESPDLIVSAIGDWEAEGALNEWHVTRGRQRPILYGWTEPHACAGHAVMIRATGGCLGCGLDNHGALLSPVTTWPSPTYRQEPACGGVYQPYGPIELGHIVSIVAELALKGILGSEPTSTERVWVGDRGLLASCGGSWSSSWRSLAEANGPTGFIKDNVWQRRADCSVCGR